MYQVGKGILKAINNEDKNVINNNLLFYENFVSGDFKFYYVQRANQQTEHVMVP